MRARGSRHANGARRGFGSLLRIGGIVALLVLTAYAGVVDGIDGVRSASTSGQRTAGGTQLFYGACAVATLVAMFARRNWVFPLLVLWGVALTVTGTLAPIVYGGTDILAGAAGGAAVAMVVGLVLWGWRRHVFTRE